MSFVIGEVIEGAVTAGMFELFRQVSPDKYLEEERRYNSAMIDLERCRVEWREAQDGRQNRIDEYMPNKSEARGNERDTMQRLMAAEAKDRPMLEYQPPRDFSDFRSATTLVGGVGL